MKRTKTFLMFSLTGLLAIGLAACGRDRERAASQAEREGEPMAGTTGEETGTRYREGEIDDAGRNFLNQQIQSNMAEVELARMGEQRASSEQVRELARELRESHERAGQELRNMAGQHQMDVPSQMDASYQQTMDRLRGLSGKQFDSEFLRQQVQMHEQAIQQYRDMSQQAANPQLRSFASTQLPVLEQHLRRAQELQSGSAGSAGTQPKRY